MKNNLNRLLHEYNDLIFDLDAIAKEEEDTTELDMQKVETAQELRPLTETKRDKHKEQKLKNDKNALVCSFCMCLVITIPVVVPLCIYFMSKRDKHSAKERIYQQRLDNLDNIKRDIHSIQETLTALDQNPEKVSTKVDEEVQQKINSQVENLKGAITSLAENLSIDISERPKHGPKGTRR